jgi:hypothetical protein
VSRCVQNGRSWSKNMARCLTLTFPKSVVIGAKNESHRVYDNSIAPFFGVDGLHDQNPWGRPMEMLEVFRSMLLSLNGSGYGMKVCNTRQQVYLGTTGHG